VIGNIENIGTLPYYVLTYFFGLPSFFAFRGHHTHLFYVYENQGERKEMSRIEHGVP
jgi:hypothetical protein